MNALGGGRETDMFFLFMSLSAFSCKGVESDGKKGLSFMEPPQISICGESEHIQVFTVKTEF